MRTHIRDLIVGGIVFEVKFNYSPAEPVVMYEPDGGGYPGCPSEVELISIHLGEDNDLIDFFSDKILEEFKTEAEESLSE